MKSYRSFAIIISISALLGVSCSTSTPPASSSAGALTANSTFNPAPARPFAKHTLNASGSNYLNEFMRPDVRARLDEEPSGDTDGGYDPGAVSTDSVVEEPQGEPVQENQQTEEGQAQPADGEDSYATTRLDTQKYSWATKSFGDAVKASPTNNGVIVLYADENLYDLERLTRFVEDGRNRVAERSEIPGERIQVVFGGYRSVPQVELWVIPQGGAMPEFKTDDRSNLSQSKDQM